MIVAKIRGRRELLKEFPEQVLDAYLPDRAAEFVDEVLLPYSDAYEDLLDQEYAAGPGSDGSTVAAAAHPARQQRLETTGALGLAPPPRRPRIPRRLPRDVLSASRRACCCGASTPPLGPPATASYCGSSTTSSMGLDAAAFRLDEEERAETLVQARRRYLPGESGSTLRAAAA